MKMTRSRVILAIILQCVIAVSTAMLLFSFIMNFTFASPSYIASRFPSGEVAAQCDEQLTKKYTAPELKELGVSAVATTDPRKALEYIQKKVKGDETLIFKGSQYLEWIIEKLLADPKDAKKLCRREKAAVQRRKSWGLDS